MVAAVATPCAAPRAAARTLRRRQLPPPLPLLPSGPRAGWSCFLPLPVAAGGAALQSGAQRASARDAASEQGLSRAVLGITCELPAAAGGSRTRLCCCSARGWHRGARLGGDVRRVWKCTQPACRGPERRLWRRPKAWRRTGRHVGSQPGWRRRRGKVGPGSRDCASQHGLARRSAVQPMVTMVTSCSTQTCTAGVAASAAAHDRKRSPGSAAVATCGIAVPVACAWSGAASWAQSQRVRQAWRLFGDAKLCSGRQPGAAHSAASRSQIHQPTRLSSDPRPSLPASAMHIPSWLARHPWALALAALAALGLAAAAGTPEGMAGVCSPPAHWHPSGPAWRRCPAEPGGAALTAAAGAAVTAAGDVCVPKSIADGGRARAVRC